MMKNDEKRDELGSILNISESQSPQERLESNIRLESVLAVVLSVIETDLRQFFQDVAKSRVSLIIEVADECKYEETKLCAMYVRNGQCSVSGCALIHEYSLSIAQPAVYLESDKIDFYNNLVSIDLNVFSHQQSVYRLFSVKFVLFDEIVVWDHCDSRIWASFHTKLKLRIVNNIVNSNHRQSSLETFFLNFPIECVATMLNFLTMKDIPACLSSSKRLYHIMRSNSSLVYSFWRQELMLLFDETIICKMLNSVARRTICDIGTGHVLFNIDDSYTGSCLLHNSCFDVAFDASLDILNITKSLMKLINDGADKRNLSPNVKRVNTSAKKKKMMSGSKRSGDDDSDAATHSISKRTDDIKPSNIIWSIGHRSIPVQVLLDVSSDGRLAVSVGECGDVRLWELQTGTKLATVEAGREGRLVEAKNYDKLCSSGLQSSPSRSEKRSRSSWPASQCPTVLSVACGRKYIYVGLEKVLSIVDRDDFCNVMQLRDPWFRDGVTSCTVINLPIDRDYLTRNRRNIDLTREVVVIMTSTPAIVVLDCQTQSILLEKSLYHSSSNFFPIPFVCMYSCALSTDFGVLVISWRSNLLSCISLTNIECLLQDIHLLIDSRPWDMGEGTELTCSEWSKLAKSVSFGGNARIPPTTSAMEQVSSIEPGSVRLITTSLVPSNNVYYLWNLDYRVNRLTCLESVDISILISKLHHICSRNRFGALSMNAFAAGDSKVEEKIDDSSVSFVRHNNLASHSTAVSRTCISRCLIPATESNTISSFLVWKLACIGRQHVLVAHYPSLGFVLFHASSITPISVIIASSMSEIVRVQSFSNTVDDEFIFQTDCAIAVVKTGCCTKEKIDVDAQYNKYGQSIAGNRRKTL